MKNKRKQTSPMDSGITKRELFGLCGRGLLALTLGSVFGFPRKARAQLAQKGLVKSKKASFFTRLQGDRVQCNLCPKQCLIPKGKRGPCRVRENRDGELHSLVYGNPCAFHIDPVERNPFFHVLPSTFSLALATAGCNFRCKFCQTWEISQAAPEDVFNFDLSPKQVISQIQKMGVPSVTYTFVEPVIFYEYLMAVGTLAQKAGLLSLIHSNGYINPKPLHEMCRVIDAANIDLKGFTETFYRELCDGELAPVLETMKILKQERVHLEITNLIVPTKNDDPVEIKEMCLWIRNELGADTPLHFWRFYPLYKLKNLPPTPVSTLEQARAAALSAGLEFVYIGNIPGHESEHTYCPACKKILIQRTGYMVGEINLDQGKCKYCGKPIPGVWA